MDDLRAKKKPGPKPKSNLQFEQPESADKASEEVYRNKEKERKKLLDIRKKSVVVTGWGIKSYYNRPKKANKYCKLILMQRNQTTGHVYETILRTNVPIQAAKDLHQFSLTATPELIQAEHLKRCKKTDYGLK